MAPRSMRRSRPIVILAVALVIAGCSSWQPLHEPVSAAIEAPQADRHLLVHTTDGRKIEIQVQVVTADTLRGLVRGEERAIALKDIAKVESLQTDGALTAAVVVGVLGVVFILFVNALGDAFTSSYSF